VTRFPQAFLDDRRAHMVFIDDQYARLIHHEIPPRPYRRLTLADSLGATKKT
jgi:hypothetical protein